MFRSSGSGGGPAGICRCFPPPPYMGSGELRLCLHPRKVDAGGDLLLFLMRAVEYLFPEGGLSVLLLRGVGGFSRRHLCHGYWKFLETAFLLIVAVFGYPEGAYSGSKTLGDSGEMARGICQSKL